MEQLSRVKKYEQLRNAIENEGVSSIGTSEVLKEVTKSKDDMKVYTPSHEKTSYFHDTTKDDELDTTFKNEYLDSFIQEVRDYNIKKGVREYEDTKLDILQQLSRKNRERRANYVEQIADDDLNNKDVKEISDETMEISKQVFNLLNDEVDVASNEKEGANVDVESANNNLQYEENQADVENDVIEEDNQFPIEIEDRIASLESQLVETTQQLKASKEVDLNVEFDNYTNRELVEETMKLKVQIDEYKDELEDLNTGVDTNNRLLNIIITILIIALLGVIGIVVYWLVTGGII